jgi:hypothetical protein
MHIDKNFRDDMQQVSPVTGQTPNARHELPANMRDKLTSMRWNLPDGVLVMLYQDANGKKQQIGLWGQGQVKDLDLFDFNDKASRWSWAYVGTAPTMAPKSPNRTMPPDRSPPSNPRPSPQPAQPNTPPSTLEPGKP